MASNNIIKIWAEEILDSRSFWQQLSLDTSET